MKTHLLILLITLSSSIFLLAQPADQLAKAQEMLNQRGEIYFRFPYSGEPSISVMSKMLSIDRIEKGKITAYANSSQFADFLDLNLSFEMLTAPSLQLSAEELNSKASGTWDFYPSWQVYLEMMNEFVSLYPEICKIDTIGYSEEGKAIFVLKISDEVHASEPEPSVYLNATMHGDETAGYVTMLRFIDYLLNHYYLNPEIEALINSSQIYINPLANPDGAFAGGNQSVAGATRYNANGVDLNRNFPDPQDGNHPDGNPWQAETLAEMNFMFSNPIHLSVNIHGGAEVVNYPWDTWSALHADNDWYVHISRMYVDTAQFYAAAGLGYYMSELNNGITNGFAWYTTDGSRQDFANYFTYSREVTLEMSLVKMPAPSQLYLYWEASYRSFIQYIRQAHYGFQGFVYDEESILPIKAKLLILNHDQDHSEVYSDLGNGFFCRPIAAGTYDLVFTAPGYQSTTLLNQQIGFNETKSLTILMKKILGEDLPDVKNAFQLYPNPSQGTFLLEVEHDLIGKKIEIFASDSRKVFETELDSERMSLETNLSQGLYFLRIGSFTQKILIHP